MAKNNYKVLLGFEDELVTEKYKGQLNFTTNKIGGKPDLPMSTKLDPPKCPLCQLPRPMVVQLYAPLENSLFHRTLYLFACINPNCWNSSESWLCLRIQTQEKLVAEETIAIASGKTSIASTDWCAEADDWDDDNNGNCNEENGNVVNMERISDEDDESCSLEDSLRCGFGNLTVDDRNANVGAQGGAVGRLHSPAATAEIEGNEGEVISIDSPTMPQNDLAALLQEVTPLPPDLCHSNAQNQPSLQFVSSFMAVCEESNNSHSYSSQISDRHVKELLLEYQINSEALTNLSPDGGGAAAAAALTNEIALEKYEKSQPAHGDKMFYHFLSKIQANSSQILRYSRDADGPLLLYPLQERPQKCQYCQGDLVFEFQLVPTIISKLKLVTDVRNCARLEFGTVVIFTCRNSCWTTDTTTRIETVVLQSEVY